MMVVAPAEEMYKATRTWSHLATSLLVPGLVLFLHAIFSGKYGLTAYACPLVAVGVYFKSQGRQLEQETRQSKLQSLSAKCQSNPTVAKLKSEILKQRCFLTRGEVAMLCQYNRTRPH